MQTFQVSSWEQKPELLALTKINNPPKQLFASGKWNSSIFSNCVAVVGSRHMTNYGKNVIDQLIPHLVLGGKTIVSGFMYGVDQYAHQVCLENGGHTIAVLGYGIDTTMDEPEKSLAHKIITNQGLILSEWQTQKAALWTFPFRNRIVVGICQQVIVVEAALKSGSLITAELAHKYHRELCAVPGPITSKTSAGTNNLIATGKAKMWTGELSKPHRIKTSDPILKLLESENLSTNEIARKLNLPISKIAASLSIYVIENRVVEQQGIYYLH